MKALVFNKLGVPKLMEFSNDLKAMHPRELAVWAKRKGWSGISPVPDDFKLPCLICHKSKTPVEGVPDDKQDICKGHPK